MTLTPREVIEGLARRRGGLVRQGVALAEGRTRNLPVVDNVPNLDGLEDVDENQLAVTGDDAGELGGERRRQAGHGAGSARTIGDELVSRQARWASC